MSDLNLCRAPSPETVGLEPCCRLGDHTGSHYWWYQAPWDARGPEGVHGIQVYAVDDRAPRLLRSIYALEVAGAMEIEEVAALVAYLDEVKKGRPRRA